MRPNVGTDTSEGREQDYLLPAAAARAPLHGVVNFNSQEFGGGGGGVDGRSRSTDDCQRQPASRPYVVAGSGGTAFVGVEDGPMR